MTASGNRNLLFGAALLGLLLFAGVRAEARDADKAPLFNTFYLAGQGGTYALSLSQSRTFSLTGPCGTVVNGTFVASDDEIALLSNQGTRHFAYNFDRALNVAFVPTRKDTPGPTVLGSMPPSAYSGAVMFTAAHNYAAPCGPEVCPLPNAPQFPVVTPAVVTPVRNFPHDDRWDRNDNRWNRGNDRNGRDERWDRRDNRRGHFETRTQQVLVEPARTDRRLVPAQFETRRDRHGHLVRVEVRPAHWETYTVPARYETREVKVWVEGR